MDVAPWSEVVDSREEQRRKKRQAVIEAGAALFVEAGYERTSLDDIAKKLGITKRTIYYYVQSKEEILMQCIRQSMDELDRLSEAVDHEKNSVKKSIETIIVGYSRWIVTDFGACLVLTRESMLTDELRLELRSCKSRLDWHIRNTVTRGQAAGEIHKSCDPKLVSAAIFGALNWVPFWNRSKNIVDREAIASQFTRVFINGVLGDPSGR